MSEESNAAPAGTRVEFKVTLKGRVPAGKTEAEAPTNEAPPAEEIPRIARLLALAHRWQRLIDEGRVKNQAEIARLMGLSRTRVTQIMQLRWLAPAIQHRLLDDESAVAKRHGLVERDLRRLVDDPRWARQLRRSA